MNHQSYQPCSKTDAHVEGQDDLTQEFQLQWSKQGSDAPDSQYILQDSLLSCPALSILLSGQVQQSFIPGNASEWDTQRLGSQLHEPLLYSDRRYNEPTTISQPHDAMTPGGAYDLVMSPSRVE